MSTDYEVAPSGRSQPSSAAFISNAMVRLHREHFGRGPASAKTLIVDDTVICVLGDVYTTVEKTLIRVGRRDNVRETRLLHQLATEEEYIKIVEEALQREVISFASAVTFDPDQAIEMLFLAPREGDPPDRDQERPDAT
jgi:uncharacterized protein YbcI